MTHKTNYIKHLIRKRQRLYNKTKWSGHNRDWVAFRHLRKNIQTQLDQDYWQYINNLIDPQEDKTSTNLWTYLKSKCQDSCGVSTLKSDTKIHLDRRDKAEALNKQFCSVFTHEDQSTASDKGASSFPTMPDILK